MLVTHHLLRETPPAPGLALRLQSVCEPRRRDRLPEEAMSEEQGAGMGGSRLARISRPPVREGNAAAESRGARRRGDLKSYEPSFVPCRHSSA